MDVGAKAGFYTEKSPKMLLHEWCVQKKRPTPRYRITGAEEGEQITKAKVHSLKRPAWAAGSSPSAAIGLKQAADLEGFGMAAGGVGGP